jgi:hypothetical protein
MDHMQVFPAWRIIRGAAGISDAEGTGDMVKDLVETFEKAKRRAAMGVCKATRPVEEAW